MVLYAGYIQSKIKGQDPHQLDEIERSPGMYKSVNGGMSWFPINNGLPMKTTAVIFQILLLVVKMKK